MPDEIVEIAEGDDGSDSLMNVVLLFAFLFVCYKAAEHFGWINKQKETGVPSGTPGTTSAAAGAVTGSGTSTVPGSGTPGTTSGTPAAIGTGAPGDEATKAPGGATKPADVMIGLLQPSDALTIMAALRDNGKLRSLTPMPMVNLDVVEENGSVVLKNAYTSLRLHAEKLALHIAQDAQYDLHECVGLIDKPGLFYLVYLLLFKSGDGRFEVACFSVQSFERLCATFPSVGVYRRSYVHVDANTQELQSFCGTRSATCVKASNVPYETAFLHRSIPRVTKIDGTYSMYVPEPAPQPMAASTSIAGAPTTATVESPPAP
jgi:hypothetical protein